MKPITCKNCGYLEEFEGSVFCLNSNRYLDSSYDKKRNDDCPLDKRPKDDADKKGFYLIWKEKLIWLEILLMM